MSQLVRNIALTSAVGLLLTAVALLPSSYGNLSVAARSLVRGAAIAAAVAAAAVVTQTVGTVGEITGVPFGHSATPALLSTFLVDTALGRVLVAQAMLAVTVAVLAVTVCTARGAGTALLVAFAATVLPAAVDHGSPQTDHVLSVLALALHLAVAAAWVGGLVGLVVLAARGAPELGSAVARYSPMALVCAVGIAVSGILSAWVRLADREDTFGSGYAAALLAKLVLFVALVGIGWAHRRRTVPRAPGEGVRVLRGRFLRLTAVELVVMFGVYGVAVGLSRTPPPPRAPTVPKDSVELLGFALPVAPSGAGLLGDLHLDAFGLAVAGIAGPLYLAGVWRLHRRGDAWPAGRTASFLGGVVVVLAVTCTGTGKYALALFSVHMAQHMTLNMVAPLLLVLGAPITLALRALPPPGRRALVSVLHCLPARVVAHPVITTGIFVLSLYTLYFTPLFEAAMRNHWGHLLMQTHFLVSGALFFSLIIGSDPDPQRPPHLVRVPLLLAVMLSHTVFSVVLVFGGTAIGGDYYEHLALSWAPAPIDDQALGGVLAWVSGEIVIVGVLAALILQWFRAADRADRTAMRARSYAIRNPGTVD